MVQHSGILGISIDIKVDGEVAEEFMPPSDFTHESTIKDLPQVTRFIESKNGQGYTIKHATTSGFRFEEGCDTLFATVIIDGHYVKDIVIHEASGETLQWGEVDYVEYKDADGVTQRSRMIFSDIPTGKHLFTRLFKYSRP